MVNGEKIKKRIKEYKHDYKNRVLSLRKEKMDSLINYRFPKQEPDGSYIRNNTLESFCEEDIQKLDKILSITPFHFILSNLDSNDILISKKFDHGRITYYDNTDILASLMKTYIDDNNS